MKKIQILNFFILSSIIAIAFFACSNENKIEEEKIIRIESKDLEKVLPQLLNKSVKETELSLDLEKEKIIFIQEPPLIIRGFYYKWNEEITIEFMIERMASVNLKKEKTEDEINKPSELDYSNLLKEKVIGIRWEEKDYLFFIGKGFLWNHYLYHENSNDAITLQKVKKGK